MKKCSTARDSGSNFLGAGSIVKVYAKLYVYEVWITVVSLSLFPWIFKYPFTTSKYEFVVWLILFLLCPWKTSPGYIIVAGIIGVFRELIRAYTGVTTLLGTLRYPYPKSL